MFVYEVEPIDDWGGWRLADDVFRVCAATDGFPPSIAYRDASEWYPFWERAQASAGRPPLHWEGDIREGPYVSMLPDPDNGGTCFLVAWKQNNNGTCYIASPFALPWLEDYPDQR